MPIRPENKARYPKDWALRSYFVRFVRGRGKCEWCGAEHGKPHPITGSIVVLTTAHVYDDRPEAAKHKDYSFLETVAAAAPVNWTEKPQSAWRKFAIFNQNGSGSCVAQTMRKLLGVLHFIKHGVFLVFSGTHIYQRRANKPAQGMGGDDVFQIAQQGTTLNEFSPSDGLTDQQMDGTVIEQYKQDVGKVFKIINYLKLPIGDIETVASVIQQTGKAVMVWFYWELDELTATPAVKNASLTLESAPGRHSVAAVDFTLYGGKKALIIEDSWGESAGLNGQRVIDEDFFKARNYFAAYPMNFTFDEPEADPQKPVHNFTENLEFIPLDSKGQIADAKKNSAQQAEVAALQDILKYEGLFPSNTASTGYYGAITAKAVYQFQVKYQVAPADELDQLQGKIVGPKTIKVLNQKYG